MSTGFHLFVYGTLRRGAHASGLLAPATFVREASVEGTLYDIDGRFPALMLYGGTRVHGEVWRCPADLLPRIDAYEALDGNLFRRVAVDVEGTPCWTYVAGAGLARRLTSNRRLKHGDWLAHASTR